MGWQRVLPALRLTSVEDAVRLSFFLENPKFLVF